MSTLRAFAFIFVGWQVGFDLGDGKNYYAIPDSGTSAIINITSYSNALIPGTIVSQVGKAGKNTTIVLPGTYSGVFNLHNLSRYAI